MSNEEFLIAGDGLCAVSTKTKTPESRSFPENCSNIDQIYLAELTLTPGALMCNLSRFIEKYKNEN